MVPSGPLPWETVLPLTMELRRAAAPPSTAIPPPERANCEVYEDGNVTSQIRHRRPVDQTPLSDSLYVAGSVQFGDCRLEFPCRLDINCGNDLDVFFFFLGGLGNDQ